MWLLCRSLGLLSQGMVEVFVAFALRLSLFTCMRKFYMYPFFAMYTRLLFGCTSSLRWHHAIEVFSFFFIFVYVEVDIVQLLNQIPCNSMPAWKFLAFSLEQCVIVSSLLCLFPIYAFTLTINLWSLLVCFFIVSWQRSTSNCEI